MILVDARRGLEGEERQLYEWLGTENVPAQVVFTKVDKLSATERGLLKERSRKIRSAAGRRSSSPARAAKGIAALWGAIFEAVVRGDGEASPARRRGPLMAVSKAPQAFVIERMRPGDLDAVMEIERVSFRAPWSAQVFSEEMVRDWAHVDVVRDAAEGFLVAFGNYWLVADEIHLLNLATHPLARRAGHASRLLAHIIEFGAPARLPDRHARGAALERRRAAALSPVRLQAGRRSPELLRRGPGRRDRHAAGPDLMTTPPSALLPLWLALRAPGAPGGAAARSRPAPPLSRPISRVTTHEPAVAITFDACATKKGWYGFDRDVFDILKREQVPATIFVSGRWVDTHPEAMGDLTSDPLIEFGDHSYDHPHMTQLPAERVGEEIDQTEAALGRYGRHSVAFRPPFGDWNRRVIEIVHGKNLPTVTWDVVSGDPERSRPPRRHDPRGASATRAPDRSSSSTSTAAAGRPHEALPAILSGLRERGFRFVPLSELMRGGGPPADLSQERRTAGTTVEAQRSGLPAPTRAVP